MYSVMNMQLKPTHKGEKKTNSAPGLMEVQYSSLNPVYTVVVK